MNTSKFLLLYLLVSFVFCFDVRSQNGEPKDNLSDPLNAGEIIDQNRPALVSIWYFATDHYSYTSGKYSDTNLLNGSGFVINEDGIIVTNNHVVEFLDSILVKTSDGVFFNAEVLFVAPDNDLALLKITNAGERKFPRVNIGSSDSLRPGMKVYAIGSPLGFEYTISEGIISAVRDNERVEFFDPISYSPVEKIFERVIQITAPISPGNSGGVLMNTKGQVIGITTYSYGFYGNLNFAIGINSLTELIKGMDLSNIEFDPEFISRREESLFSSNLRIAEQLKSRLYYNWWYSEQADTMTVFDTIIARQDSINKINFLKAEDRYIKCIEIKPEDFYVYQQLMDLYLFTENFSKAENLYVTIRASFESDSLLNTLSSSLANAYLTSKNYDKALVFFTKMLDEDTSDVFIKYQIANLYNEKGDRENAFSLLRELIRSHPEYTLAYIQLGRMYYDAGKYRDAEKYLNDAYENDLRESSYSYNTDLHYYRGMLFVKRGRKLDAILAYLELKSIYTYSEEEKLKKLELYKAISAMNE